VTPDSVPLRTWLGFLAMCGGTFMAVLDTQIVASSLPDIAASLGATVREASWIQTAYMIAEVVMIPLAGWLSGALTLRRLYALASFLFTLSSLFCALCWSLETLVCVRILQGLCSGLLAPLLYQGIYLLFPRGRQPQVTLYVVLVVSLAPIIGPTLGGWITQNWSWRWLFLVNLLPGVAVSATVRAMLPREPGSRVRAGLDLAGILLLTLCLGPLEYVLGTGADNDWFASRAILISSLVAGASFLALVWRELSCQHPVINLRSFGDRNFSTGCFFNFAMGIGLFGSGYLMVLFLGAVKRYNSQQIGQVMAVPGAAMLLTLPLLRMVRKRIDPRVCLALGLALFASALGSNASLSASVGFGDLFWPQFMRGSAIMMCLGPITELTLGRLPAAAIPNATGLYSLMRSLGGGIGIALMNLLVEERSAFHYWRLAERLNPERFQQYLDTLQESFAARMPDLDLAGLLGTRLGAGLLGREAALMAYNDAWLVLAGLLCFLMLLLPAVRGVTRR
jgi:MFS transporter, DHA2 family, multidrug resistance protein